jgi:DNA-binding transcriptional LysR family regulator
MMQDELLVRTAAGMEPTPRALELIEPVRQLLRQAEKLLEGDSLFDPAKAKVRFRVRMSDVLGYLLMPHLLKTLGAAAPGVSLDIVHLPPAQTISALENDELDLAVSMELAHSSAVCSSVVLQDRMVCVMSALHPLASKTLTLERFLGQAHLKVSMSPSDGRYVDAALAKMGKSRRVALNVPHWLVVPEMLRTSSLLSVMSEHLAQRAGDGLVLKSLPFAGGHFVWSLYWHRRNNASLAQRWLRDQLVKAARNVQDGASTTD